MKYNTKLKMGISSRILYRKARLLSFLQELDAVVLLAHGLFALL